MKRIAIFAPYVGTVNRGAETFVIELTRKLSAKYEVDVYTLKSEPLISDHCICVDVRKGLLLSLHASIYNTSRLYRKVVDRFYYLIPDVLFQRAFTKKTFKVIDERDYHLLFPNNGVWGAKYSCKYRKHHRIPYIYTGHGGIGQGEKYIIETEPDAYVCLTNKHLLWANEIKKSEKTKIALIPNGVNVSDFNVRRGSVRETKRVLSVAALTEFKRHRLTIMALSRLPNVQLTILGKGEDESELKKLADKYMPGRCQITSVSYHDMKEQYASADLFVLPSREEPFGIVYLEAMASNLPIVAPDDSQRREIIGNAGLYCDVENLEEYASSIQRALHMEWGTLPLKRARQFDWAIITAKYEKLIEEVLANY